MFRFIMCETGKNIMVETNMRTLPTNNPMPKLRAKLAVSMNPTVQSQFLMPR